MVEKQEDKQITQLRETLEKRRIEFIDQLKESRDVLLSIYDNNTYSSKETKNDLSDLSNINKGDFKKEIKNLKGEIENTINKANKEEQDIKERMKNLNNLKKTICIDNNTDKFVINI